MKKWGKTRELGLWGYVFLYGILMYASGFLLTSYVFYTYQGYFFVFYEHLLPSIIFGSLMGICIWFLSERQYKKYVENNRW
ncbi:hypothetical protein B0H94_103250 [Salsuginibacillus halophilus]|uniref:Uncharacterized protein n=1 Tax=Salsuginibacillus halophilus TaxID=517424 RepID=A0A2P8HWP5_9BACI|nr:hypothetical protein B0H94_103250 [Salsuginibacillus halophilus]